MKEQGSEIAPEIDVTASGKHLGANWKVGATGLYGGAFASGVVILILFAFGSPNSNPNQFMLACLACFTCGAFTNAVMSAGRLHDAQKAATYYRTEVDALAVDQKKLNESVLKNPRSSVAPPAIATSRGKKSTK